MAMAPPPFVVPGVNNGAPNAAFTVTTVVTTVLFNEAVATIFITATETLQQTIKETVQETIQAVVLFAVNIFFTQRIVRSIQPFVGWHPVFSKGALFLLLSVPAVIILNVVSLIISFFSVGNSDRLAMTGKALLAGSSWIVWLSVVPLVFIAPALVAPGPPPEQFGIGPLRIKVGMVFFSSLVLATGAVIRLYTADNPERPGTSNPLFGRAVFYTTGFLLEIMVVYLYAFARIDLLFHVPNGSSGPGDYSKGSIAPEKDYSPEEIEKLIVGMGVPHQIKNREDQIEQGTVQAVFFTSTWKGGEEPKGAWMPARDPDDDYIPSRPERVTRRQTMLEAIRPQRPIRQSTYPLVLEPDNREYDTGTVEPQYDTSRAANQQYV
ncbi:hypothetical protein ACHAQH_006569 [Verticillium albo-atrum]